jgi:hypothetical protein
MKDIILIVIYNKNFERSETIKSLLLCEFEGSIIIFNNGPNILSEDNELLNLVRDKFISVKVIQDISNKPLSIIYNDFLCIKSFERYFIFDDDTNINHDFFRNKKETCCDLSIPIIRSITTKKICYPVINNCVYKNEKKLNYGDEVISIGSGLMISASLIEIFFNNSMKLFDERYALYGVDYSLFRRINSFNMNDAKINIDISECINHSLSSVDEKPSKKRELERLIDLVLTKMYYPKRYGFQKKMSIMKTLFIRLFHFDFMGFYILTKVVISKCHPRCNAFRDRWNNLD